MPWLLIAPRPVDSEATVLFVVERPVESDVTLVFVVERPVEREDPSTGKSHRFARC
jgi:hypothetical protein